ncbi:hypothetical protein ACQGAO_31715 [Rhodococcus sp. 1.20]|uniref:hypothetical protein n=1 Tax=Rhodococcus qingshengii TaxID=334542 RepID=UPI00211132B1|nr:hypothetical protein [Rhodococcus qingshengii]UUE28802.1 hypothetical protein LRQ08_30645 [Rhodococcus qingshengii]
MEGKSPTKIQRCLKHHTAREIYMLLVDPPTAQSTDGRRPLRPNRGLSTQCVDDHFYVPLTTISQAERATKPNYESASRYRA